MPGRHASSRWAIAPTLIALLCGAPARGHAEPEHGPRPVRQVARERGPSAQPQIAQPADDARARMQDKLAQARGALQRARENLKEAHSASAQAAHEAAREAGEKLEQARETGSEAAQQAGEKLEQARETGSEVVHEAGAKLQAAGERVRLAAHALGDRLREARRAAFQALQGRVDKPSDIPPDARAELRVHARRMAHLQRIRAVAEKTGDTKSVERTDKLIAREESRHREQLAARLDPSKARIKPAAAPAAADDDEDPGSAEPEHEVEDPGAEP